MHIVLLGHRDIASLLAMDRLIRLRPAHRFSVMYSDGAFASDTGPVPELTDLARRDAQLVRDWRQGRFDFLPATALRLDAPTIFNSPNSAAGRAILRELKPDLVVSIRYRKILRPEVIAIPRFGVINIHSGPLPDYRGVMATFWAMLEGDDCIGSTIHRIVDAGIDTGPVFSLQRQPMRRELSYLANVLSLYPAACAELAALIDELDDGRQPATLPQTAGGNYFSMPGQAEVRAFLGRGLHLAEAGDAARINRLYGAQT